MQAQPIAAPDWPFAVPLRARDGSVRAWTLLDEEDYRIYGAFRWSLLNDSYAFGGLGRRNPRFLLHRLIAGLERGDPREVDHKNGDTLDNRRGNLRVVTKAQQQQNIRSHEGSSSHYRNVNWDTSRGLWLVRVTVAGKTHNLGRFTDEDEAGRVAAEFRAAHMPYAVDR